MLATDLTKLRTEKNKGAAPFLKFLLNNYVPEEKKFELTDEMLNEG